MLAHNVVRWVQLLGASSPTLSVAKTLNRQLLSLPVRISRTAQYWTLHLPTGWPWRHALVDTLTRLRPLPAIA